MMRPGTALEAGLLAVYTPRRKVRMSQSVLGRDGCSVLAGAFTGRLTLAPAHDDRATVAEFLEEMTGRVGGRMTEAKARTLMELVSSGQIALPSRSRLAAKCAELAGMMP